MSLLEAVDVVMDERQWQYATASMSSLEDVRGLLRDVGKFSGKAGLPLRFRSEAARIQAEAEDLEQNLAAYLAEMNR